ncbi:MULTISPECIES: class I SAM-dependent methyltransferase [unclassified Caballeronia]|uniref:class I SAM-dependent methyltransferase n=1 Tax=unclassified Caballeronia TaxID=2646786 RepID=UPI0020298287|nr:MULTISPECIES: class I SAM-dependent methyltransferase [unclassified Caballeronia]
MSRVYGKRVELEKAHVQKFFEDRGRSIDAEHPLTSVLYQDKNPALAENRDAYEKAKVASMLRFSPDMRVLDVGCGIGRWADELAGRVGSYHGIDFGVSLIDAARARCRSDGFTFQVMPAQEAALDSFPSPEPFDLVMIAGVLLYLNDQDLEDTLSALSGCCKEQATIYVREPVARCERLTLKDFESEELGANYNAIYRTTEEIFLAFQRNLFPQGFCVKVDEELYPPQMNNRTETTQRIFVLER